MPDDDHGTCDASGGQFVPQYEASIRREQRLDELRELGDDVTDALRALRAKRLCEAHELLLQQGQRQRAAQLLDELGEVVGAPPDGAATGPVREMWFWLGWALAVEIVDAIGRAEHARAEVLFLRQRVVATVVGDEPRFAEIWATSLEAGHAAAIARGRVPVADERLAALREVVATNDRLGVHLARALDHSHAAAVAWGDRLRAAALLEDLRAQAGHGWALAYERVALSQSLRRAHAVATPVEVEALLAEAAALAGRVDATEELRHDLAAMLGSMITSAPWTGDMPDVILRERAHDPAATPTDVQEMIARLVRELAHERTSYLDGIGRLHEIRTLLERDDAEPNPNAEHRIRFAELWFGWVPPALGKPEASELAAREWARAAARAGDPRGDVLLGHCHRRARGVARSPRRARAYYTRAHRKGNEEATYWLRRMTVVDSWWVRHAAFAQPVGLGLLALHAFAVGPDPTLVGIALAFLVSFGLSLASMALGALARGDEPTGDGWIGDRAVGWLRARPLRLLGVVAEDGIALLPCALFGVSPLTAVLAGALFGAMHYPAWRIAGCLRRGAIYALTVGVIAPSHGLWSIPIAHILFDAVIVAISAIEHRKINQREAARSGSNAAGSSR